MLTIVCTVCGFTNYSSGGCARCGNPLPFSDAPNLSSRDVRASPPQSTSFSSPNGVHPDTGTSNNNPYAPTFPVASAPSSPAAPYAPPTYTPNTYQSPSPAPPGYAPPAYGLPQASSPTLPPAENTPGLEEANARIKKAWITGVVVSSLTFLVMAVVSALGMEVPGVDWWLSIDVVIIFGLTFGIYKKSRTCAVSLFSYYLLSKIIAFMESGRPGGIIITALFLIYFARGIQGTFAYHRLKREAERGYA